jgi:hypothetical protein
MTRAVDQIEWNYRQFRRRVKRWVKLPDSNTKPDIEAVVKCVFRKPSAAIVNQIVSCALLANRDLSAVGDILSEVRFMPGARI